MPGHRPLRSRGLGALIGLVAVLTGAGAIGNGRQLPPPAPVPATPTAAESSVQPNVAAEAPSGAPSTKSQSSLHPMVEPGDAPAIKGDPRYGSELRFARPDWRPGSVALAYQWLRDGAAIPGATDRRHRLSADDIGHEVSVRITGTRAGFETAVQETDPVGPVVGQELSPQTPSVYGWARVGGVLAAGVRPWGPGTVRLAWQWYRDGVKIDGATATTYELVAADLGHTIKARVRGTAKLFEPASRFSRPTAAVVAGTLNPTPVPVYSGVAQVGQTLTALPKRWGPGDVTLSFQWYRSGDHGDVRIKGATRAKYTLVDADAGHRVKVRVTGRKPGYTTVQRYSAWTSTVASGGTSAGTAPTHR